jgi:hypothetical protein
MKSKKLNEAFNYVDNRYLNLVEKECDAGSVRHRQIKHAAAVALAACLILALSATAVAAGISIYKRQQQKLSESLKIEENQVHSYVEADVESAPEEVKPGIQFISSLSDGEFQRVYLSLNPVTADEAHKLLLAESLDESLILKCILSNDEIPDEAFDTWGSDKWVSPIVGGVYIPDGHEAEHLIDFPDPVTGESFKVPDSEYRRQKTYEDSYDEETQTLLVEFSVLSKENVDWTKPVNIRMKLLETKSVMTEDTHNFDPEEYKKTCKPSYIKDFGVCKINAGETETRTAQISGPIKVENAIGECSLVSASISPGGAKIKLHIPGGNKIFNPEDSDSDNFGLQLEWVNYLDDLLRNAEIVFNDGSSVKLQASSTVPCEDDVVTLFSAWESTINIYETESIRIGGVTLKLG